MFFRVVLHGQRQCQQFGRRVELVLHPTVSVLQVSKLVLAGHFHVQLKVLFHFGDIAHKDLAAVLFYADYRLFQLQLVVERVRDGHCKGKRADRVGFQCHFRVKDHRRILVKRVVQNVSLCPVVALSVRRAFDLPDVHHVPG